MSALAIHQVVEVKLPQRHGERLGDGLSRVFEILGGLVVVHDEEAEAEAHHQHQEVGQALEEVLDDAVEHEADAAAEERVAPHQEDQLQVGQADAEGGYPPVFPIKNIQRAYILFFVKFFLLERPHVLLAGEPCRRQPEDCQLQQVLKLHKVPPRPQRHELERLLHHHQQDGEGEEDLGEAGQAGLARDQAGLKGVGSSGKFRFFYMSAPGAIDDCY